MLKNHFVQKTFLTLKAPKKKLVELANSVDPDDTAHNEPPHLDLYCLPSPVNAFLAWLFSKKAWRYCHSPVVVGSGGGIVMHRCAKAFVISMSLLKIFT